MTIKQISLFLENKPGHLGSICKTLTEAKINIVTLSLADTQQFGIVRMIVNDWEKARDILSEAGFVVNVRDEPGGMEELLNIIGNAEVNIEYMYAFASHIGKEAVLVFRFDNPEKAEKALEAAGRKVLDPSAIFSLN